MKKNIYLMMLFLALTGFGSYSTRIIRGTVYNQDDNLPLAEVTVLVPGTSNSTKTNKKGFYLINVPQEKTSLLFVAPGFQNQQIRIGSSGIVNVQMKALGEPLQETTVASSDKTIKQYAPPRAPVAGIAYESMALKSSLSGIHIRGVYPRPTESYKGIAENGFLKLEKHPLSTFAADVDAASYSNVRRFINSGTLPPQDAVRIEEMINYFNYDMAAPASSDPVAIYTELSTAPWNARHQLLRIGIKAKKVKTEQLPPSNFVFLIDVSGSMEDANKLPLVKASMKLLVDQLRSIDRVAIVTYAGEAGMPLPSTPANQRMKIKDVIDALGAAGSTAGGAGISMAYQIAQRNFIKGGNNRIIMATDGDFNVGDSSDEDMEKLIVKESKSGIHLSVLGFGMGNLKDSKMETLADKGHGNYAYIDNIAEARKSMVTEFGATLFTVAKDVKIQVEFNPSGVQAYRLLGYENRLMAKEDFNNDNKIGGDMGVGHTVTAFYEIIPAGLKDNFVGSVDPLKYQQMKGSIVKATAGANSSELATVKFRYKDPEAMKSKLKTVTVSNQPLAFNNTTDDFRFASAVAELGMLLRDSEYKQQSGYDHLIEIAKSAKGKDEEGYRTEFIGLAKSAKLMSKSKIRGAK